MSEQYIPITPETKVPFPCWLWPDADNEWRHFKDDAPSGQFDYYGVGWRFYSVSPTKPVSPPTLPGAEREANLRHIEECLICHGNFPRGMEMTAAVAEKILNGIAVAPFLPVSEASVVSPDRKTDGAAKGNPADIASGAASAQAQAQAQAQARELAEMIANRDHYGNPDAIAAILLPTFEALHRENAELRAAGAGLKEALVVLLAGCRGLLRI